jgi:hypothetical protein
MGMRTRLTMLLIGAQAITRASKPANSPGTNQRPKRSVPGGRGMEMQT